ncbi:C4-dicarboxylic acid transporter DauA [Pirellulimonas nuda]|uniref:C4-dicarboxylic acid transporter DauA n=1 Tax=Pirellulimonas nuda TaxID=2528009 RepID=A0A518DFJ0_9BACT|nr:SulP family inorganic anion transporter [Pirellulimonas nuda]QDU90247.1 C4-dicarboxylic acid transporter DauA [Pirellulimonas nuda]
MSHPAARSPQTAPGPAGEVPVGDASGFVRYLKHDLLSGFLVFLIALPLCLGISLASGYPPLAGIFTAIIGAIVTTFLSNSELTIKGPAAGLIVIALGCINEFQASPGAAGSAYQAALAVGVAAAVLQICFGLFRAGILGEFFPSATVHGMLAAIGVIIMIKQIPVALGVSAKGEPLEMLREIPTYVREANPAIAAIGLVSIAIMFLWPVVKKRLGPIGLIPAPMIVLLIAVGMGEGFDLLHKHSYTLQNHEYQLSDRFLVAMPDHVFGMFEQIAFPDFTALNQPMAWKWVFMFFAIGSLESLLSAKAVDLLDPWKRKTNMNRDVMAVGIANLGAAMVGGLPMISEIVRSKANIDNGARTRFADLWHGLFLLLCVALIPMALHHIPLAALAAMLVYTGFRLAHPMEFVNVYRIGKEQLAIFVTTLVMVLATDLLMGVAAGILLKISIHVANGVPLRSLFKPYLEIQDLSPDTSLIIARDSAVFSNWIPFRRQIEQIGLVQKRNLIIDLSDAKLVDHSTMEKLEELHADFQKEGIGFEVRGLGAHRQLSKHALAARKQELTRMRRITVLADASAEAQLERGLAELGARGFSSSPCRELRGAHRQNGTPGADAMVRIEIIAAPGDASTLFDYLENEPFAGGRVVVFSELIEVLRSDPDPLVDGGLASDDQHALLEASR